MLSLQEPYAKRPIRFLELWQEGEWRLKLYSITYQRPALRTGLLAAAKTLARERLALSAAGKQCYGAGFLRHWTEPSHPLEV